ncbi:hypothetical protein EDD11_008637 [Mortierella claussenii]|nr:hypothetical protein EDD11_008637 [Mortierella claussenii]
MSALQRLQEFRFKKAQGLTPSTNNSHSTTASTSRSSSTSSSSASNSASNGRISNSIVKKTEVLILDSSDNESDQDLRKGVKKMTTGSPLRGSPNPTSTSLNGPSPSSLVLSPPRKPDFSASHSKSGFKKMVTSFRYTGEGALPSAPFDSDHSLSSPQPSDTEIGGQDSDDVVMQEEPSRLIKNKQSTATIKRQIVSSDDEEILEAKPRRRLIRKGDLDRSATPEAPKRRRLVKRMTLASDDDEEDAGQSTRSGSTTIQVSDDDLDSISAMDLNLAKLQTTFPDTPFDSLKRALDNANGDFATAASRLVTTNSKDLFDLTPHAKKPISSGLQQQSSRLHQSPAKSAQSPVTPKKKKPLYSSDDNDSFDDDDGPNTYKSQDRKEERALQFFNGATMLELQELTGCSKAQATGVIALRPFDNYDHLCVTLRKTKGVGEKIVNNYLTTTDAIRAVDTMLKTVDRVREDLAGTLSVWCGDENGKLFGSSNTNTNKAIEDKAKNSSATPEDDDDDSSDPGMELLEVDADKVEQTEAGRRAMKGFIRRQPDNMAPNFQLKGYQLLGINWLALLWRKKLSGILADEMGLGKTAQVIAFLAHLLENGEQGPFLIIVPSSVLDNWLREFANFCPDIDVRSYYGSQAEREELRHELEEDPTYNVIVTTYAIATGNNDERKFLNRRRFKGIVLDEGHMLKNCTSARYKQLMSIKTPFRLLLTGTPLQNNLEELLSLLIFIMPDLFAEHEEVLRTMFKVKVDANSEKSTLLSQERIVRARHMLAPFVLRRKKVHVISMPRKVQKVIFCDLHPDQRVLYDRIMASSALREALGEDLDDPLDLIELEGLDPKAKTKALKKAANAKKAAASSKKAKDQVANVLMQMRKAADHPMLFRELYTGDILKKIAKAITREVEFCDSNIDLIEEDMTVMTDFEIHRMCKQYKSINKFALPGDQWMHAGKVQELERLLPQIIHKEKSRVLIFSQFTMVLDILESILKTMDFKYLRMDGQTKVEERQPLIDSFNEDDSHKIFLLSTKAGGFGINLTGANVVIMYDLDFNPHNDKQAEDRAHRVGQTKDVEVIKLISKGTIEEQIYQLANLKLKLDQHVSQDDAGAKALELSSSSSSGSSTPSAGILSLIKQNLKASLSAAAATNRQESAAGLNGPITPVASLALATMPVLSAAKREENNREVEKEKEAKSMSSSSSSLSRRSSISSSSSLSLPESP